MTREQMIELAQEYEKKLREAVAVTQPDLTDKDMCHLLSMKCVQYEIEVQKLQAQAKRPPAPLRILDRFKRG